MNTLKRGKMSLKGQVSKDQNFFENLFPKTTSHTKHKISINRIKAFC